MNRVVLAFALFALSFSMQSQSVQISPRTYDYGTIQQGHHGTAYFRLKNGSSKTVYVSSCYSNGYITETICPETPINPGGIASIQAVYDTDRIGLIDGDIEVYWSYEPNVNYVVSNLIRVGVSGRVISHRPLDNSEPAKARQNRKFSDDSNVALSSQQSLERDVRAFVFADDDFDCSGEPVKHENLEDLVTSYFGTDLQILERRNLEVILNEQKSSMQGIFDESTIVEAGKLAGAKYVLIPKVSCFLGEEIYNLKIISCLDATTMASANASAEDVKLRDFLDYVESQLYP